MRSRAWTVVPVAAFLCLSSPSAFTQDRTGRDLEAMVAELRLPAMGAVNLALSITLPYDPLPGIDNDEQALGQLTALQQRTEAGTASADEWAQVSRLLCYLSRHDEKEAAQRRALALYRQRLQQQPDDADALLGLGEMLSEQWRFAEAETCLGRSLELGAERPRAYGLMAEAFASQAKPMGAWFGRFLERVRGRGAAATQELEAALPPPNPVEQPEQFQAWAQEHLPGTEEQVAAALRGLVEERDILAAQEAEERGAQWAESVLPQLRRRLWYDTTEELFCALAEVRALLMLAEVATGAVEWLNEGDEWGLGPASMLRPACMALTAPDMMTICARLADRRPDSLRFRALSGFAQGGMVLTEVAPLGPGAKGGPLTAPIRQLARQAADNLAAAMALPAEKRGRVLGDLALMYLLTDQREACAALAEEAIRRGEWDEVAAAACLLAQMGITGADVTGPGFAPYAELLNEADPRDDLPSLAYTLGRWLEAADPEDLGKWDADHYANLARMLAFMDDWEGAAEALERAGELNEGALRFVCGLGVAYLKLRRYEDARRVLAEAVQMHTHDQQLAQYTHYAYGVALFALGRAEEAEVQLNWGP